MSSVNMVVLGGRVGTIPEEKKIPNGKTVTSFRLANSRWDSKVSAEVADWYTVSIWDREAERCAKILQKGASVLVEGRLTQREWNGTDGKKNIRFEVVAHRVNLLAFAKRDGHGQDASTGSPPPQGEAYSEAVPF